MMLLALLAALVLPAQAWEFEETNLARLEKHYRKAVASPQPWSGDWYAYTHNGIAWDPEEEGEINAATKYDMLHGTSSVAWEVVNHGRGVNPPDWFGHCNGWSAAAILEPEPLKSRRLDGIEFDAWDRKALLTESYQDSVADFVGTRVWDPGDDFSDAFWDVVPAHLHLMLTNVAGRDGQSFVIDKYTGHEVWNQPVTAYELKPTTPEDYLGPHPEFPDIFRVNVEVKLWWNNDEDLPPGFSTPVFDFKKPDALAFDGRTLRYELWLDDEVVFDAGGKMIGSGDVLTGTWDGVWVGGVWKNTRLEVVDSHPDFIWLPYGYGDAYEFGNPWIDKTWTTDALGGGS